MSKGDDEKMTVDISVYADPELKRLAGIEADRLRIPLSEYFVRAVAEKLGRPDLAVVPRKLPGRPRKEITAGA